MKKQQEDDQAALKTFTLRKQVKAFSCPWSAAGHPEILCYENMGKLKQACADSKNPVFDKPFIVEAHGLRIGEADRFATIHNAWLKQFPENASKKGLLKSQNVMGTAHGSETFHAFWDELLPQQRMTAELLPSVKAVIDSTYLWGYTPTVFDADLEPSCLGSARVILAGSLSVLAVSASSLKQFLPSQVEIADDEALMVVAKTWFMKLGDTKTEDFSQDNLTKWKEAGLEMHHKTVTAGQVLVVPPGWMVAVVSGSGRADCISGVRKSFLPCCPVACRNLEIVSSSLGSESTALATTLASTVEGMTLALSS